MQNNFLGTIILFIIFLNIKSYIKGSSLDQKLFLGMLVSTVLIMVSDILINYMDAEVNNTIRSINVLLTTFYFFLNPLPFFIWTLYVNFKIHEDEKRLKKLFNIMIWPVIINTVLSIVSIFYGLVFFIDDYNVYNRGDWFLIVACIYYSYSIYTVIDIVKSRNYLSKKKYYSMFLFILLPFLGGTIQVLFPQIKLLWVSLSISLMMVFINLQKEQLHTDSLTGLYNRRHLESYITERRNTKLKKNIGMLMIDIDCFKKINDTFGHAEGDQALGYFSEILRESFRKNDTIFRYAGDEFVVIIEVENKEELEMAVNRMKQNINIFNESKITKYDLNVSVGYDILDHSIHENMKVFINHIDNLMYNEKLEKCGDKKEEIRGDR